MHTNTRIHSDASHAPPNDHREEVGAPCHPPRARAVADALGDESPRRPRRRALRGGLGDEARAGGRDELANLESMSVRDGQLASACTHARAHLTHTCTHTHARTHARTSTPPAENVGKPASASSARVAGGGLGSGPWAAPVFVRVCMHQRVSARR